MKTFLQVLGLLFVVLAIIVIEFIRSRCAVLIRLLGRLRPRRLNESRDSGYGLAVRRFERELLREES